MDLGKLWLFVRQSRQDREESEASLEAGSNQ